MKNKILLALTIISMVLTTVGCGVTEQQIEETVEEVEYEIEAEQGEVEKHEHEYVAVSNNDGTHTYKCECGTERKTEECAYDENYICTICGYQHQHTYDCISNEDGTHTYTCICGDTFTEDCNLTSDGLSETCDVCGYTRDIYTFTDLDKTMYVKSGVNVRTLPNTDCDIVKTLSVNDEVHVIGKCNEDNWYKLEDGTFVHGNYLSDEKVTQSASTNTSASANTSGHRTHSVQTSDMGWQTVDLDQLESEISLGTIYDNGDGTYYYYMFDDDPDKIYGSSAWCQANNKSHYAWEYYRPDVYGHTVVKMYLHDGY